MFPVIKLLHVSNKYTVFVILSDIGFVQRKRGRGDTTLSMSCFDKITRWSAVGIQGLLPKIIPFNILRVNQSKDPRFGCEKRVGFLLQDEAHEYSIRLSF